MNKQQKEHIIALRAKGISYGKIAAELGLSVNTVKSFCQRNKDGELVSKEERKTEPIDKCAQCGAKLLQQLGHRRKRFCSTACRMAWWRAHPDQMKRNVWHSARCCYCGKLFSYYGNRPRKYCGLECYQQQRVAQGGDAHG